MVNQANSSLYFSRSGIGGGGCVLGVVLEHVVFCRYHNMLHILISLLIFHKEVWRLGDHFTSNVHIMYVHAHLWSDMLTPC